MFIRPARHRIPVLAAVLAAALLASHAVGANGGAAQRVVVVGDVHGDLDAFTSILQLASVIDGQRKWKAGSTILVQTGDYLDRGPRVREVLDLFMSLEREAAAAGGKVIVLLGNHEVMNLIGDLRDIEPEVYQGFVDAESDKRRQKAWEEYEAAARAQRQRATDAVPAATYHDRDKWLASRPPGYVEYREAMSAKGKYGKWIRQRPAAVKVQDLLLVHGGINPDFVQKPLDEINAQVRSELDRFDRVQRLLVDRGLAASSFDLQELVDAARVEIERAVAVSQGATDDRLRPRIDGPDLQQVMDLLRIGTWYVLNENGPLWYRGYAKWTNDDAVKRLEPMLERYGVARVVVGHTTLANSRIAGRFSNRVFLIDTGMLSAYYKGRASALEFREGKAAALYVEDEPVRFDP